ncbi:protein phosphatase [candidate division BRC1 bacterium HGW-BRC1-1]|jgi:atypical dual specificity phosphatase|nr:MAG: protein phosphatase [candidate division BRC1 bacterium HGW-BRC1-1]
MILRNFSFIIPNVLAGCAHPQNSADLSEALQDLQDHEIASIVSLDEYGLPGGELRRLGLRHLHIPIQDFTPPTFAQADEFVAFVDAERSAGRAVVAHCMAGIGRTGTMIACYLVAQGQAASDAIATVREQRPGSVETREQESFIAAYADHLKARH